MLLLLFIILLPVFTILEAAKKSQDPVRVLFFFCDYIPIRQDQQNQKENQKQQNQKQNQKENQKEQNQKQQNQKENQQDAGPAEPEPEAAGFRLQASGSWLQAPGFRQAQQAQQDQTDQQQGQKHLRTRRTNGPDAPTDQTDQQQGQEDFSLKVTLLFFFL